MSLPKGGCNTMSEEWSLTGFSCGPFDTIPRADYINSWLRFIRTRTGHVLYTMEAWRRRWFRHRIFVKHRFHNYTQFPIIIWNKYLTAPRNPMTSATRLEDGNHRLLICVTSGVFRSRYQANESTVICLRLPGRLLSSVLSTITSVIKIIITIAIVMQINYNDSENK